MDHLVVRCVQAVLGTKRVIRRDELGSGLTIVFVFAFSGRVAAVFYGDSAALRHLQPIYIWSTASTSVSHLIIAILIDGINGQILVLVVEDVVVQDVIVASLFLEKVAKDMSVLFVWVDSDKASPALVFKH